MAHYKITLTYDDDLFLYPLVKVDSKDLRISGFIDKMGSGIQCAFSANTSEYYRINLACGQLAEAVYELVECNKL